MPSKRIAALWLLILLIGCLAGRAQSPVFGPTFGGNSNGGGNTSTITLENIYAAPGSFVFAHSLNSLFPLVSCYTQTGGTYGPATFSATPVDANDTKITVPSAGAYICSFSSTKTLQTDFSIASNPTTLVYEPTLSGTQQPTFAINQTAIGGYSGTANYTVSGLASGMTGAYSPTSITGAGSSTLTLSFPFNQAVATTNFTVQGTDGTHTHTASPSITVGNINSGLVEAWAMTDGSGSAFADSWGTGNTETLSAGTLTWGSNPGLPGTTATFSTTAYASGANNTATNFTGATPFSACTWVDFLTPANTAQRDIMSNLNASPAFTGWEFYLQTSGNGHWFPALFLINQFTNNLYIAVNSTTEISNTALHHVCFAYDGSKTAAGVSLYMDGAQLPVTVSKDTLGANTINNSTNLSLGGRPGGVQPLIGIMAYARIWNRQLSATDVANYYAAGAR